MAAPTPPPDLLDLKLMPAWVNEPGSINEYANFEGEVERPFERSGRGPQRGRDSRPRSAKPRERSDRPPRSNQRRGERPPLESRPREAPDPLPQVAVRFLPHPAAFASVVAQLKSASMTYSVFALARMFLDKPERYDVHLTVPENAPLHQLGEGGPVAADRRILENGAFVETTDKFYTVEVTQTEPIKGNFTNVGRDRASGTLLGPTNHHAYQPQLRSLYEQRYSRRMSFPDFQRQIEIVSDPAVVEQWKEQARSVTTYTTQGEEPAVTFQSVAEAERHFRQTHLPSLLRSATEMTISGVLSRRLPDRGVGRVIEDAWAAEIRSPSKMMQELAGGLRGAGLNIFRHRKGMLFVSPVRTRAFNHDSGGVSASINGILQKLNEKPGVNRKQLAENLVAGIEDAAEVDRIKLSLASDLRWLVTEGYVIEFNDGSLDLPRTKQPPHPPKAQPAAARNATDAESATAVSTPAEQLQDAPEAAGGMEIEQSVSPMAEEQTSLADVRPEPVVAEAAMAEEPAEKVEPREEPSADAEDAVPSPS